MNITRLLLLTLLLFAMMPLQAAERGLGLVVGEPTGLHYKQWVHNKKEAVQAAIGWNTGNNASLQFTGDYVSHNYNAINVEQGKLPIYYGIGANVVLGTDFVFGLRIPLGLNYQFANEPFGVFLEIVPGMQFLPDTAFTLSPALGAHYFF